MQDSTCLPKLSHGHGNEFPFRISVFPSSSGEHKIQYVFLGARHQSNFYNIRRIGRKLIQNFLAFPKSGCFLKVVVGGNHLPSQSLHHGDAFFPWTSTLLSGFHLEIDIVRNTTFHSQNVRLKIALSKGECSPLSFRPYRKNEFFLSDDFPALPQKIRKGLHVSLQKIVAKLHRIDTGKMRVFFQGL